MSNAEVQRLLQAVAHFQARTRGAELPKGTEDALKALQGTLGQPLPGRETPGAKEALKLAPGTDGTGESFRKAGIGPDGPSPGQKEANGISAEIARAAAAISAKQGGEQTPTEAA